MWEDEQLADEMRSLRNSHRWNLMKLNILNELCGNLSRMSCEEAYVCEQRVVDDEELSLRHQLLERGIRANKDIFINVFDVFIE